MCTISAKDMSVSDFRPNPNNYSGSEPETTFDSFSNAPISPNALNQEQGQAPDYGDHVRYNQPDYVSSPTPDEQGFVGGVSTAYSGPKVGYLSPGKYNPTLGPRVYRPDESTAFQGPRGGYTYGGQILHTTTPDSETAEGTSTDSAAGDVPPPIASGDPGYPAMTPPPPPLDFSSEQAASAGGDKKKLYTIIGASSAALLLVLAVAGYFLFFQGEKTKPEEIVTQYFAALEKNDASGALQLAQTVPEDTTYLTDDMLKKQNAAGKISNYTTKNVTLQGDNKAKIDFSINFGDQTEKGTILAVKKGNTWSIATPAVAITKAEFIKGTDPNGPALLKINDKDLPEKDTYYFFPGKLSLAIQDKHKPANAQRPLLYLQDTAVTLLPQYENPAFPQVHLSLVASEKTHKVANYVVSEVKAAIGRYFKACATSHKLNPSQCSFLHLDSGKYKEDSVHWDFPRLDDKTHHLPLTYDVAPDQSHPFKSQVPVHGTLIFPYKATPVAGAKNAPPAGTLTLKFAAKVNVLGDTTSVSTD